MTRKIKFAAPLVLIVSALFAATPAHAVTVAKSITVPVSVGGAYIGTGGNPSTPADGGIGTFGISNLKVTVNARVRPRTRLRMRGGAAYRCHPGALVNQLIDLGPGASSASRVLVSWDNTDSTGATISRGSRTLSPSEVATPNTRRYLSVCL
jgi:hypothetical protein